MSYAPGVAIVTGGSQGIGAACVRRFVQSGWRVATIALHGETCEPGTNGDVLVLSGDLANEHVCRKLIDRTLNRYGRIDALVNNAGVGLYVSPSNMEIGLLQRVFEVNVLAPLCLAQLVIPIMRRQRSGTILNVGSVAGNVALPWTAGYSASKFALHSITDSLRRELRRDGIRVIKVCPGIVDTDFRRNVLAGTPPLAVSGLRRVVSADAVAQAILSALTSPSGHTIYVPAIGRVFTAMQHLLPWLMDWYLDRLYSQSGMPAEAALPVPAGECDS